MKEQKNGIGAVWLGLLFMPLVILFISQLITLQSIAVFAWMINHLYAVVLGWLLLTFIGCFLLGLTGRLWIVWILTAIPCVILTLINHFKMQVNGFPLLIGDFSLAGQFGEITGFAASQIKISFATVLAVIIAVGVTAALIVFGNRFKVKREERIWLSVLGVAVSVIIMISGTAFSWAKQAEGDSITQEERIKNCGVLVGLFSAWASTFDEPMQLPDDELVEQVVAVVQPSETPTPEVTAEPEPEPMVTPTVIFLMSESFFDVTELEGVSFNSDPIPNFHRLEDEFSSGKFISNTYSGGTGYAEMEVMTGLCSCLLKESDTLTSLPDERYNSIPCISDVFGEYGYRKEFLHSYNSALYNRAFIYDAFGFDSVRFDDSFPDDAERSGGYISDMALAQEIISSYENKGEAPLMMFAVSMENHQPYTAGKYGAPCEAGVSSDLLAADELACLDAYTQGLMNADRALGYLTDYFSDREEPVVIVFWGDHLPNLSLTDGSTVYQKVGRYSDADTTVWDPDTLMSMLSTDYVIWSNYELPEEDVTVGSAMLGLHVMKLLNFKLTGYYGWLGGYVADRYTMYRPRLFVDEMGNASRKIPEDYRSMMDRYAAVVYDIAYGGNQLFMIDRKGGRY